MNQSALIGFTLFLLIIILLMLLFSDAKEKSSRIRVLVYISGRPEDPLITGNINTLLENLGAEGNFDFTVMEEALPMDFNSFPVHSVILHFHPYTFTGDQGEFNEINPSSSRGYNSAKPDGSPRIQIVNRPAVWTDPAAPYVIWIAGGADASRCTDPGFALEVNDAILKAASLKKNQ
jgi:hypothetical protein